MRNGKMTKVPYATDGVLASSVDPATWDTFENCKNHPESFDGIGFVFKEGVVGIDLDHCIGDDGVVLPWAREILEEFPTYTEKSPSGEGLHLFIESDADFTGRRKNWTNEANGKMEGIECYMKGRFFTVTGDVFEGRSVLKSLDVMEWHKNTFVEEKTGGKKIEKVTLPSDEKILSVIFGKREREKLKAMYMEGKWDQTRYASHSEADLALVETLMYFCCNQMDVVDRLFRRSEMMRDKWDERRDSTTYGRMTMERAWRPEVMKWKNVEGYILTTGKDPVPALILENICRAFENDQELAAKFRLNEFSHMVEALDSNKWEMLNDFHILRTQRYVSTHFGGIFSRVSKEMTIDAIRYSAGENRINPVLDYFRALKWDGIKRLDIWLCSAFGATEDNLHKAMGSNWIKGLVKRVLRPGCVFDEVLVLEGRQGMRKSTALRVLGKPWHTESTLSTDDKDFYMLLARNVILEFSEGEIISRTSAQKLKAIITKTEDTFRPPYEHGMMTFKRSCVFAMTTNNSDYQKDETGGRRWLPVVLQKEADTDWIEQNRDQLFAEAIYRVEVLKESSHEYPREELAMMQEERMEEDAYDEPIAEWYDGLPETIRKNGIRLIDVFENVIMRGSDAHRTMEKPMEWRLSKIFSRVLRLQKKTVWRDGKSVKRWVK